MAIIHLAVSWVDKGYAKTFKPGQLVISFMQMER